MAQAAVDDLVLREDWHPIACTLEQPTEKHPRVKTTDQRSHETITDLFGKVTTGVSDPLQVVSKGCTGTKRALRKMPEYGGTTAGSGRYNRTNCKERMLSSRISIVDPAVPLLHPTGM